MRGRTTKRVSRAKASAAREGMRREHRFDYTKARPNRFAAPRRGKTTAVVLDPDVASVFDSPESVNRLPRAVIAASPAGVKRSRRRRRPQAAMRMRNPPHPGEIIKALCLEPLGVTITQAAKALGVSRKTLSAILNGRAGISPEMAVRLSMAFGTSAKSWLNQQTQHDLWHADRRRRQLRVAKLTPA